MPKTREQYQQIKDERKNDIIIAAIYLFAFKGYGATSVDDIADASKCSHGLFYHYFSNKEDLFNVMMHYIVNNFCDHLSKVDLTNQKAKFALHDLLSELTFILKDKDNNKVCMLFLLINLYLQKKDLPKPKAITPSKKNAKPLFIIFNELIEEGQKDGDFLTDDSSRVYAIALLTMIKGLAYNRLYIGYKEFICPSAEIMMNLVTKR